MNIRKNNGSTTITGADGKIATNVAGGAVAGPAPSVTVKLTHEQSCALFDALDYARSGGEQGGSYDTTDYAQLQALLDEAHEDNITLDDVNRCDDCGYYVDDPDITHVECVSLDYEPKCDYCGRMESYTPDLEWNGDTGCHEVCEEWAAGDSEWVATFHPEAWVGGYATRVDPEGETTWRVSAGFAQHIDPDADPDNGALDFLQTDPRAPEWVRNWSGPFEIRVEGALG